MVINILSITILEEALLLIYTFDEKIVKKNIGLHKRIEWY